jgi:hypothetical protein
MLLGLQQGLHLAFLIFAGVHVRRVQAINDMLMVRTHSCC